MNREQMIEEAALAIHRSNCEDSWEECSEYRTECWIAATAALDAILPQVSTVEELEALPPRTLLLAITDDGPATPWWDTDGRGGPVRLWSHDGYAVNAEALLDMCPLTVVWQP